MLSTNKKAPAAKLSGSSADAIKGSRVREAPPKPTGSRKPPGADVEPKG